jgi:hypothetical protein
MLRQAAAAPKEIAALGRELGVKATAKLIAKDTVRVWTEKQGADLVLSAGGIALTAGGPLLTATESHNYFGWRSAQHFTADLRKVFEDAPDSPDLQPKVPPRFSAGGTSITSPEIGPAPPQPVMDR